MKIKKFNQFINESNLGNEEAREIIQACVPMDVDW
jgi:hypothetical protein